MDHGQFEQLRLQHFTRLPAAVRHEMHRLEIQFHQPGAAAVMTLFSKPDRIQLELLCDHLMLCLLSPEQMIGYGYETTRKRLAVVHGRLSEWVRQSIRDLAGLNAILDDLTMADQELTRHGPGALLAQVALHHIQLHLRIYRARSLAPATSTDVYEQLWARKRWLEQQLDQWQRWTRDRFGPVECVAWNERGTACRSLGYRLDGRIFRIKHLGEYKRHQQRVWHATRQGPLALAVSANRRWGQLIQDCRRPPRSHAA